MMRIRKTLAVAMAANVAAMGCYTYVPAPVGSVPAGSTLRVQLNNAPSGLTNDLRPNVAAIGGLLESSNDAALTLTPDWYEPTAGLRQQWIGATKIAIPRGDLAGVQVKTIDRNRSIVAAVLTAAAVTTAGIVAMHGGSASGQPREPVGTGVFIRR